MNFGNNKAEESGLFCSLAILLFFSMKFSNALVFSSNPEYLDWLQNIVDYISAFCTNSSLWPTVKKVAQEGAESKLQSQHDERAKRPFTNPEAGYVSNLFYLLLASRIGRGQAPEGIPQDIGGGIDWGIIDRAFTLLAEQGLLFEIETFIKDTPYFPYKEYKVNEPLVKYLVECDLVSNHLFGFEYIVNRYSKSVVKIEVRQGDAVSIGTGWFLDLASNSSETPHLRLVITNAHVLEGCNSFRILTKNEIELKHNNAELMLEKTGVDIALIKLADLCSSPDFYLSSDVPVLEEVITIGYPSVPLSREAYQVVHRGEVNAQVTDMWGQDLLIISARTAPGNSGSPVIDDTGRVIGMVARELFEKSAFHEKGITPYSACIPARTIQEALSQSTIYKEWFGITSND